MLYKWILNNKRKEKKYLFLFRISVRKWVARDSNPELVGRSRKIPALVTIVEGIPPQTVLAFFIAHGFTYVYIKNPSPR